MDTVCSHRQQLPSGRRSGDQAEERVRRGLATAGGRTAREQACDKKAEEWLTLANEQAGRGAARAPSRRAASAAEERKHAGDKQAEECSRVGGEQAKERQPAAGYASHGGAR